MKLSKSKSLCVVWWSSILYFETKILVSRFHL
jgi:hypothetical protein